jgi:hypothetical protein
MPGYSSAAPGRRNLVQINTVCEDLINVLEEKLRDINAGAGKDDISSRRPNHPVTSKLNHPKETSLSGTVLVIKRLKVTVSQKF